MVSFFFKRELKINITAGVFGQTRVAVTRCQQETMEDAARRRLKQEMGIDLQPTFAFKFIYKTDLDQNLIEHEYRPCIYWDV